jgi:hypothetical protein
MKRLYVLMIIGMIMIISIYGKNHIKTLHSDSIDELLVYPEIYKEGPDGLIYVADFKDYYIKVYSSEGKYLRKFGGRGEGPGQIKRMGSFGFSTDKKSIFFVEYFNGHKWITFTDLNGNYKNLIKLDTKERYGVYDAVMLPDSRFLLEIHKYNANAIKKYSNYYEYYSTRKLRLINKNGVTEKEFLNRNYINSISMKSNCCDIEVPFQSAYLWQTLDGQVIFTDGLSTDIKIVDFNNRSIGRIKTPLPHPGMVTQDDLDKWRNKLKNSVAYQKQMGAFAVSRKVVDLYKKSAYEKKINLKRMSLTSDRNILIEIPIANSSQLVSA